MAKDEKEKEIIEEIIEETDTAEEVIEEEETVQEEEQAEQQSDESLSTEELEAQLEGLKDRLMRNAAEFDNFKKRTAKEKEELYSLAVCDTVTQILPVLDNLQRAVAAAENSGGEDMLEGVKMIGRQLEDVLSGIGVTPIEAVGNQFDPELHNAVMQDENADADENIVTEELMKGYTYKGKVVRHSMVKVAT